MSVFSQSVLNEPIFVDFEIQSLPAKIGTFIVYLLQGPSKRNKYCKVPTKNLPKTYL